VELAFLRFLNIPAVIWLLEARAVSWFLNLFLPWMEVNDPLPPKGSPVRFIFLISYAATPQRLTNMSRNTTEAAAMIADRYPGVAVIGCEFSKNPEGSREWEWKTRILSPHRSLCAGPASSSTDERELLVRVAGDIDNSIVMGNGLHIRRDAMVWRHYHPRKRLCFRSTPAKKDNDLENPMTAQRRWQTWEVANLVGILFYRLLGVEYFAKKNLSQPVE
jgi:hypothetical protein